MSLQPHELKLLARILEIHLARLKDWPNRDIDLRHRTTLTAAEAHVINKACELTASAFPDKFAYYPDKYEEWGGQTVWCAVGDRGLAEYLAKRIAEEIQKIEGGDRA